MNFIALLSKFMQIQCLVSVGACLAIAFSWWNQKRRGVDFRRELRGHYGMLIFILLAAVLSSVFSSQDHFLMKRSATISVWAAATAKEWVAQKSNHSPWVFSVNESSSWKAPQEIPGLLLMLGGAYLLYGAFLFSRDVYLTTKIRKAAYRIRGVGKLEIMASGDVVSPFTFSWFNTALVVLPEAILGESESCRSALLHEFEHLRRGDTRAVYALVFLRWLFLGNPFFYLWHRRMLEVQEFACDEALVDQRKVSSSAMSGCLLRVAEMSVLRNFGPACATGLGFLGNSTLKRRISIMFQKEKNRLGSWGLSLWLGLGFSIVGAVALASGDLIQDRRISLAEAKNLNRASQSGDFPVTINDLVVNELNLFVGTPDGRRFIRDSLTRMKSVQKVVTDKMAPYAVPLELLAVPLVESGFQNLPEKGNPARGAGLWQFIPNTARLYGLRVDVDVDERLDVETETDAAMRLLLADRLRFKSWELSLMAYNSGEGTVQRAITKHKTRDPWELVRKGVEVYPRYLAKVIAAVLILKNPNLVQ